MSLIDPYKEKYARNLLDAYSSFITLVKPVRPNMRNYHVNLRDAAVEDENARLKVISHRDGFNHILKFSKADRNYKVGLAGSWLGNGYKNYYRN